MQSKITRKIIALFVTLLLLFIVNLFATVTFSWLGIPSFKLMFHVILILFFSLYIKDNYFSFYILSVEMIQSMFTVQGWEIGVVCGIFLYLLIFFFKDLIHLSNILSTMIYTFIFFIIWYILFSLVYYSKIHSIDFAVDNLNMFLIESIVGSILAPFVFSFLGLLWGASRNESISY